MFVIPSAVHRRRHYLLGRPFTVITDHKSLSQLLSQTIQTPEQPKWLTKLTKLLGFDFQTCYKSGSQNNVADALSRWTADATMKAISSPCFNIIDEIRRLTSTDLTAQHIISQLANSDDLQSKYTTRNGLLLKGSRIYVPASVGLQQQLIRTYHSSKEGGHSEEGKDLNKLGNDSELVLDRGFVVPDANTFGQTFRDYEGESERRDLIEEFYRLNHIHQSVQFVKQMREKYGKLNTAEMSIWECCELLNDIVDESDPDLDEPQIEHLLQTAEAIRRDYPDEDWLHLTGLIHDLGKVLSHPKFGALPQWAVVGDTFPVGCAFDKSNVHWKYFEGNEDWNNPIYNTKNGIYSEGCGLENVLMSWGHDDYMYLVAKENKTTLPSAALFIIRYHSFYPLHKFGAYRHLMNDEDRENMKWLHLFNKYDLYSKSKVRIDVEKVKPYYLSLIEKYFPAKLRW